MKIQKDKRTHSIFDEVTGSASVVMRSECMRQLKQYPDNCFDLAICDPPYFNGPEARQFYGAQISTSNVKRVEYEALKSWRKPGIAYFKEIQRVSKKYIIWGANYFVFCNKTPGRIVWDKVNGETSFSDAEIAMTNAHDSTRLYQFMWNGMCQGKSFTEGATMQGNKKKNEQRIHCTQKPVELYKWLLSTYAKDGAKILDTHIGSQSIRIALHEMPYTLYLTSCEIDTNMFHLGNERVEKHISELKIPFSYE